MTKVNFIEIKYRLFRKPSFDVIKCVPVDAELIPRKDDLVYIDGARYIVKQVTMFPCGDVNGIYGINIVMYKLPQ